NRAHLIRVEREPALYPLEHVDEDSAYQAEDQDRERISFPVLTTRGIDTGNRINYTFDRTHRPVVYTRHVNPERIAQPGEHEHVGERLDPAVGGHCSFSGTRSAKKR